MSLWRLFSFKIGAVQDEGGLGITVEAARTGWVAVRWDCGGENKYRVGFDGKFDLIVVGRAVQTVHVQGAGGVGEAVNGWFDQVHLDLPLGYIIWAKQHMGVNEGGHGPRGHMTYSFGCTSAQKVTS